MTLLPYRDRWKRPGVVRYKGNFHSFMLKNLALVFLLLFSLALGAVLIRVDRQNRANVARIAEMQQQAAVQLSEIQATKTQAAELEQKRQQITARSKADRQALREAREAAAAATAEAAVTPDPAPVTPAPSHDAAGKKKSGNSFTESIAKMMKDPAMKNMMRTAQASSLKQLYGDLVKQWNLSPEETDSFYNLLLDKQSDNMDRGMKLLDKSVDASTVTAEVKDADAQIKAALGDDRYQQYQDYEKTLSGRYTISQFQQQLAATNTPPLNADQTKVLLQAANDEKLNLPNGSPTASTGTDGNPFGMDPAQMDGLIKAQQDLNARIDARVEYTLTPEQLKVLKDQQQQMISMQRMGMEMAAKMMGPSPTP